MRLKPAAEEKTASKYLTGCDGLGLDGKDVLRVCPIAAVGELCSLPGVSDHSAHSLPRSLSAYMEHVSQDGLLPLPKKESGSMYPWPRYFPPAFDGSGENSEAWPGVE